jgi:hypothetical protein
MNKIRHLYYSFIYGIENIIKWFPVIWQDRDWSQNYIYRILYYKFRNMEYHHKKYSDSVNSPEVAKELMVAKNLCKRLADGNYLENATTLHDQNFEDVNMRDLFQPIGNGFSKYVGDSNEERDKSFDRCGKHSDYMEDQDLEFLLNHIRKHIKGWWD